MKKNIILLLPTMFFVCGVSITYNTLFFGHRGASFDAPENTLASVRRAFELGADGVEIDIHMTVDKKIVVVHDDTLRRTARYTESLQEKTGMSKKEFKRIVNTSISNLTYDQFKQIDVGLFKGEQWAQEYVPLLYQVLDLVFLAGKKVQIEIKGNGYAIIPALKKILLQYPKKFLSESVILIGFNFKVMKVAKKEISDCTVLFLRGLRFAPIPNYGNVCINYMVYVGFDGIGFEAHQRLVTKEMVKKAHCKKKIIGVWVYPEQDTKENIQYFKNIGIDFITTNLCPEVVNVLDVKT